MKNERVKKSLRAIVGVLCGVVFGFLGGCVPAPQQVKPALCSLEIYPDYREVTIPYNIAPLNFMLRNECVDAVWVKVKGQTDSLLVQARGRKVIFPLESWKAFLSNERQSRLKVTVVARQNGQWEAYPSFDWQVVPDAVDAYVSYRLIEPGYEVWKALQICERCVENFDERVLADNQLTGRKCMNCHVHGSNRGDRSFFHIRGANGGTILNRNGSLRKLTLKNEKMISAAVYGDFHPNGRYGVFSSNIIIPMFHAVDNRRLEVYDEVSDLAVADFDRNKMLLSPLTADSLVFETFPTFSADGKSIFFCSAPVVALPDSVEHLRYSLCRIDFDADAGRWGTEVDTLWNAQIQHGSVCHPKASPDGRYLLYTVARTGTFPIWHQETELQLMDLQSGQLDSLSIVNSNRSETYHSWSSNSRWFAFASKRGDGQYGRIYLAYLDSEGKAHRPFVLPQANPEHDDLNLKSYNIPDLSVSPVPFDAARIEEIDRHLQAEPFE